MLIHEREKQIQRIVAVESNVPEGSLNMDGHGGQLHPDIRREGKLYEH